MARIMVIHHAAAIGGGSISFVDVLDMLKKDHEIIPCCPTSSEELNNYIKERGYEVEPLNIPLPVYLHYSGGVGLFSRTFWKGVYNIRYKNEIIKFIKAYNPEIVIVNSSVLAFLGPIIKKCGAKAICYVRETFKESSYLRTAIMKKMLNNYFDGVIFLSDYDKNFAGLVKPYTSIIEDCVECNCDNIITRLEACKALDISNKRKNILFVGGSSRIKGLDVALRSLIYTNDDINLIVAGYMDLYNERDNLLKFFLKGMLNPREFFYKRRLNNLLKEAKISNKIKILGVQGDMSKCYSASDVVIFPSNVPHQARPVFEAAIYKKPIIISDFKQTREYVINDYNGITFIPKNPRDLAEKINELSREKIMKLGINNYNMTLEHHNIRVNSKKINDFINLIYSRSIKNNEN